MSGCLDHDCGQLRGDLGGRLDPSVWYLVKRESAHLRIRLKLKYRDGEIRLFVQLPVDDEAAVDGELGLETRVHFLGPYRQIVFHRFSLLCG